jgi:polyisoprenoid-binding protein YceI
MSEIKACSPARLVEGLELPAAGVWRIDPGHAEVGFVGRHLMFTKVRGRFRGVDGYVAVAPVPDNSTVEVVIDMASVDSGDATRDDHLRSADLFDVGRFSVAIFRGRARDWTGTRGVVSGELTIKGATRPVWLDVDYRGTVTDPWGRRASGVLRLDDPKPGGVEDHLEHATGGWGAPGVEGDRA